MFYFVDRGVVSKKVSFGSPFIDSLRNRASVNYQRVWSKS